MSLSKPDITDVKVTGCTGDACSFDIFFDPPPDDVGIEISAYISGGGAWHFLEISDPDVVADVWRVSGKCTAAGDTYVKIMFRTTDEFKPTEQRQSEPFHFECFAGGEPTKPYIDHVDIYHCDKGKCQFHVYFDPPPDGVKFLAYINDVHVPGDPVASGDLYRISGECSGGGKFSTQICFQSGDGHAWSEYVECDCALGKCEGCGATRVAPNIRHVDVYYCDGNECFFHVYFDPPPAGAEVEVYMNGVKIPAEIEISAGFPRAVLQHMQGGSVDVQLAFMTGVFRTWGVETRCHCVLFGGVATDLDGVSSSNVGAVGWHRWLESYNPGSPYYVDRQWHPVLPWPKKDSAADMASVQTLDAATVGTLLRQGEMPEDEAHTRFRKMGYSDADADYLIVLNSPD